MSSGWVYALIALGNFEHQMDGLFEGRGPFDCFATPAEAREHEELVNSLVKLKHHYVATDCMDLAILVERMKADGDGTTGRLSHVNLGRVRRVAPAWLALVDKSEGEGLWIQLPELRASMLDAIATAHGIADIYG
jgi:hypothetical protein